MGRGFELIDTAYTEKDAQETKRQLIKGEGLTVDIRPGKSPATQQKVWRIYAKKGK
jgi:hypothetical protein